MRKYSPYCQIFLGEISETTLCEHLSGGGTLVLPHLGGTSFYTANLTSVSHKCRRPIVDVGPYVIYLVDLGTYYQS